MSTYGDLRNLDAATKIIVVLVEPEDARNIGSVARAMSNTGASILRIVNHRSFDQSIARNVACWGSDIFDSAQYFTSLKEAIGDAHEVVGFASDSGRHRTPQLLLDDWIATIPTHTQSTIALVFGSEDRGLRKEHFPFCQYLIRIPSAAHNRSYNLAQSVLLTLYSLMKSNPNVAPVGPGERTESSELGPYTDMVLQVAESVGFLTEHSPHHMRELLVNVSRRGRLTTRELSILKGLFGTIQKQLVLTRNNSTD